jgi:hypothetical protein
MSNMFPEVTHFGTANIHTETELLSNFKISGKFIHPPFCSKLFLFPPTVK